MSSFTIKRNGMALFYLIPAIFVGYPFFHQVAFDSDVFFNIFTLFLYGLFGMFFTISTYVNMSYHVKVKNEEINFNQVATIPFTSIKGAYLGTLDDLKSIEERDNLPLESFKDERLTHLFTVKTSKRGKYPAGVFLALNVGHTMYLIQASYFTRSDVQKLIDSIERHGIHVERFEVKRMLHEKVL